MKAIKQEFAVPFEYQTHFTRGLFKKENPIFKEIMDAFASEGAKKLLFVIDNGVAEAHPQLSQQIFDYIHQYPSSFRLLTAPMIVPGGEQAKNNPQLVEDILEEIHQWGVCRHSFVIAIGGGAVLDMVGYAAAIAHRGVRHIRIPTTVLSQNDSGVGVKNGINAFGKKNFLGTFRPPQAVINDQDFLSTLSLRDWRSGISEAIKVALIKDAAFFDRLEEDVERLRNRDAQAMQNLIYRCAELHIQHISGGDPFEMGSSRPLDFGHWAAHKLEQLSDFQLRHGEAVAIGIALDVTYSHLIGYLSEEEWKRVLNMIDQLGFECYHPLLETGAPEPEAKVPLLAGLEEFREHLGGQLTIMLIDQIGHGLEVHEMDEALILKSARLLKEFQEEKISLQSV